MKIKHLLIVIIAFANSHTKANIWLVNDSLKSIYIGSPASTDRNLGINMRQINGIYWRYNNKFLQLDISAAHPRLAGTNVTIPLQSKELNIYLKGAKKETSKR